MEFESGRGALVVIKDASFADRQGMAALAIVGALGDHSRVTSARSSADAESKALAWAMELAAGEGLRMVDFVSDYNPVVQPRAVRVLLRAHPAWRVVAVPRGFVWRADRIAKRELRAWLGRR